MAFAVTWAARLSRCEFDEAAEFASRYGPHTCSLQRGFRHPAQPATSRWRTGACYPALRYLPGRDFHPL